MMIMNDEQVMQVSGAGHELAEACLTGGGVGAGIGSFFGPVGTAAGGLGGCALGVLIYLL